MFSVVRKGFYTIVGPDSVLLLNSSGNIRQVTSRDEAYERILEDGRDGIFTIKCPDREVDVGLIGVGTPSLTPDVTAPNVPTGLAVSAKTASSITMIWNAAADEAGGANENVSGVSTYKLYRDSVEIVDQAGLSFEDTGRTIDTAYSYTVSAVDVAGNESAESSPVVITIVSPTIATISNQSINVGSWTDMSQFITDPDSLRTSTAVNNLSTFASYSSSTERLTGDSEGSETGLTLDVTF